MEINRIIKSKIIAALRQDENKIIVLFGARQVGKTTLIKAVTNKIGLKTRWINADQIKYLDILSSRDSNKILSLVDGYELLVIDEAQRIPDIGLNLKIIHDEIKALKVIVTGSSSFDLAQKVVEPLTGRKKVFKLFPLSFNEIKEYIGAFDAKNKMDELMVYGSYPEVYKSINLEDKTDILMELGSSYLLKDIIELGNIKFTSKITDLLKLLSFQLGFEVSINELSKNLGISRDSVEKYIEVLEKAFIIFRLSGFSRNLRKEVSKMDKFYFYDLGIRNLVINNFNPVNLRNDIGQLWENYVISERKKKLSYDNDFASCYFWRTYTGAELDYVEEKNNILSGHEIKYRKKKFKAPKSWLETYPNSTYTLINKDNFHDFVN
jgi:uncharacterized protein